jgi:hypothetical protein
MDRPQAKARTKRPGRGDALGDADAGMGEADVGTGKAELRLGPGPLEPPHPPGASRQATRTPTASDLLKALNATPPIRLATGSEGL